MGCLYRRGKIYWIKYYRKGKAIMESTRSDKKEVAKRLLKRREGEISKGEIPGIYFDRVIFDELGENFIADYLTGTYGAGVNPVTKGNRYVTPVNWHPVTHLPLATRLEVVPTPPR